MNPTVTIVDARKQISEWYLSGLMKYVGDFRFKLIDYEMPLTTRIEPQKIEPEYIPSYVPEPATVQYAGILKWMAPAGQGTHPSRKYKFIREIIVFKEFERGTSIDEIEEEMYEMMREVLDDMDYPDIDTISSWRVPPGSTSNFEVAAMSTRKTDGEYEYYDIKKEDYPVDNDALDTSARAKFIKRGKV
jgi:hypothetical protein